MTLELPLVRVRLKYPDVDTFAERFAPNVTRGGIFLASRDPRPVGTLVRFEVSLLSGTPVLVGRGRVTWTKAYDPQEPSRPYGMGVQFTELDPESRPVLDRLLARRGDPARAPRAPAPTPRAESEAKTQPLRRPSHPPPLPSSSSPSPSPSPSSSSSFPSSPSSPSPSPFPPSPSSPSLTPPPATPPSPPPARPFAAEIRALDDITDAAVHEAIQRARSLAAEVKDVEALLHPDEDSPPTLAQALAELRRRFGLRPSDPVH